MLVGPLAHGAQHVQLQFHEIGISCTQVGHGRKIVGVPVGHKCVIYTDNNPLSYLQSAKLGATEHRWAAQPAAFDFDIKYQSGHSNRNADALSRQYVSGSDLVSHSPPGTPGTVPTSL